MTKAAAEKSRAGLLKLSVAERAIYGSAWAAEWQRRVQETPDEIALGAAHSVAAEVIGAANRGATTSDYAAWEEWEREQAAEASRVAWHAVARFRESGVVLHAKYSGTDVARMYDDARTGTSERSR